MSQMRFFLCYAVCCVWFAAWAVPALGSGLSLQPQTGHSGGIRALQWSPDGQLFASAGQDGTVRLWRADGALLWSRHAHNGGARGVLFSPDGRFLASWNASHMFNDYSVRVWSTGTGRLHGEWRAGHNPSLHAVAWIPGDRLALGLTGGVVIADAMGNERARLPLRQQSRARVEVQWTQDRLFARADHSVHSWREERSRWREQNDYAPWPATAGADAATPLPLAEFLAGASLQAAFRHPQTGLWLGVDNQGALLLADREGRVQRVISNWNNEVLHCFHVGPEGQLVVPADSLHVQFWAAGGAYMKVLPQLPGPLLSTGLHSSGFWLFSGARHPEESGARHLELFDWEGRSTAVIQLSESVNGLAALPDGWVGIRGGDLVFFDASGNTVRSLTLDSSQTLSTVQAMAVPRQLVAGIASPASDQLFLVCLDTFAVLRSWRTEAHSGGVWDLAVAPDGRTFWSADLSYNARHWNTDGTMRDQLREVRNGRSHDHAVTAVEVARNGEVATGGLDGVVKLWGASSPHRHRTSITMNSPVSALRFADEGGRLWIATQDGRLTLVDTDGSTLLTLIVNGVDWIVYDTAGHFDASLRGANLVRVVDGITAFAVDRFALLFNRPERFWSHWPHATPSLLEHLAQVSQTRARRTGTANASISNTQLPLVTLQAQVVEGMASLTVQAEALQGVLAGVQIYLNGVPMLGRDGHRLPSPVPSLVFERLLHLRPGDNLVEAAVRTTDGLLSYRASVQLHSDQPDQPDWYFLGIGVSRYEDTDLNLRYAAKDIEDFAQLLTGAVQQRGLTLHQKILLDEQATVSNIAALGSWLGQAREQDIVVVFIAGHGAYGEDLADGYFFLTHEVNVEDLRRTALPWSFLEDLLLASRSNRRLVLMDTCASGELELQDASIHHNPLLSGLSPRGSRALRRVPPAESESAVQIQADTRGRPPMLQRDRFIYADLLRRTGAVVVSSSRGSELSFESSQWANGLFTAGLLKALRTAERAELSVDELLEKVVPFVQTHTDRQQTPVIDRDNPRARILIPTLP